MEFIETMDADFDGNGQSLRRQRIIQAQIRDRAVEVDPEALIGADAFESAVERNVCLNESALKEMDQFISQLQQWRKERPAFVADKDITSYVQHLGRLGGAGEGEGERDNTEADAAPEQGPGIPETDTEEEAGVIDAQDSVEESEGTEDYMICKLRSLQTLLLSRRGGASAQQHAADASEYQQLLCLLKSNFGDDLEALREQQKGGGYSDDELEVEVGVGGSRISRTGGSRSTQASEGSSDNNSRRSNNDRESRDSHGYSPPSSRRDSHSPNGESSLELECVALERSGDWGDWPSAISPPTSPLGLAMGRSRGSPFRGSPMRGSPLPMSMSLSSAMQDQEPLLQTQLRALHLQARESCGDSVRQRETEVISAGADLQQGVSSLHDSLQEFADDLDRLLLNIAPSPAHSPCPTPTPAYESAGASV